MCLACDPGPGRGRGPGASFARSLRLLPRSSGVGPVGALGQVLDYWMLLRHPIARRLPPLPRPTRASAPCRCLRRPAVTWPTALPPNQDEVARERGAAGHREHSVRRHKVADAVEQQLRLCLDHPADVSAGRPRSGRALEHITLQAVEINGDLSVATVWWRLKDEEADGHTGAGVSLAELDEQRQEAARAIKSSVSWMRRRVGAALSLRKVPALRFRHADIAFSEERASGGRANRTKQQPKQGRAQRLEAAFAAIASERTQDGG